jgi:hypothetical protein
MVFIHEIGKYRGKFLPLFRSLKKRLKIDFSLRALELKLERQEKTITRGKGYGMEM